MRRCVPRYTIERQAVGEVPDGAYPIETTVTTTTTTKYGHVPPAVGVVAVDAAPAAAQPMDIDPAGDGAGTETPVLSGGSHGRSKEEFSVGAYMLDALGLACTRDDLLRVIQLGDDRGLIDISVMLEDVKIVVDAEWDGAYWHNDQRLSGDVRKTRRMLRRKPGDEYESVVLRMREAGAATFPTATEDPSIAGALVVVVDSRHPGKILQKVAPELAHHLPEPYRSRLLSKATGVRKPALDAVVDAAWAHVDELYHEQLRALEEFMGSDEFASKLINNHGVKTRIPTVKATMKVLLELGVRMDDVPKFRACFWAASATPQLVPKIMELLEMGVKARNLHSFADGFWPIAIADDSTVYEQIVEYLHELGVDVAKLGSMEDSFWAAANKDLECVKGIVAYLRELGVDVAKLGLMGGSFWAAANNDLECVKGIVTYLQGLGVDVAKLGSMEGSFWAAASDDLDCVKGIVMYLQELGVDVAKLGSMGGSFWSAANKDSECVKHIVMYLFELGVDVAKLGSMEGSFWSAASKDLECVKCIVAYIKELGVDVANLSSMKGSFWAAANKDLESVKHIVTYLRELGVDVAKLGSMEGSFWAAANKDLECVKGIVTYLWGLGVDVAKLDSMGNSFWAAANKDLECVKGIVSYLRELGVDVAKLGSMKGSFWAAANKDLECVKGIVAYLRELGVDVAKLDGFGNSFWSATRKRLDNVKSLISMLITRGFAVDRLMRFDDKFWSGIASTTSTAVPDILEILMDEYGVDVNDLSKLQSFWAEVKRPGRFEAIRDELVTKKLPSHVTKYIRSLNNDHAFGHGATKCKFVRPKVEVERVALPTTTKQATLGAFFAPKSGGPSRV